MAATIGRCLQVTYKAAHSMHDDGSRALTPFANLTPTLMSILPEAAEHIARGFPGVSDGAIMLGNPNLPPRRRRPLPQTPQIYVP